MVNGLKDYEFQNDCVEYLIDKTTLESSKQVVTIKAPTGAGKTVILIKYVDEYLKNYNNIENATEVKEIAGEGVYYSYNSNSYFIGKRKGDGEKSCVEIYENDILIGSILLSDEIKQTSINAISKLNNMNFYIIIINSQLSC